VTDPESGNVRVVVKRRRRTRRHQRNRLVRRWASLALLCIVAAAASAIALQYFSPSLFSRGQSRPAAARPDSLLRPASAENAAAQHGDRAVYPYSVVPGGVEDARELKWVAEHDPVVAAHYAGFDYERAQVVRLALARTVYVSYRIGSRIYWTHRRVTLHKGEKLITDGRMTARSRCGNRVEEAPQQQAASPAEPSPEKFDEPVREGGGTAVQAPPVPFESALLSRPVIPASDITRPLSLYDPFVGGNWIAIAPPPLPEGLCAPITKKPNGGVEVVEVNGKKKRVGSCGESVGAVPEPSTWILFLSGVAAIFWQARRRFARA